MIQLNDEQYWLYAAVDPETDESLHTKLEPTTTKVLAHSFLTELSEKHRNHNSVERIFREIKRRTFCFSNCFSDAHADTADDWLRSFSFARNHI